MTLLTGLRGKLEVTACVSTYAADLQGQTCRCTSDWSALLLYSACSHQDTSHMQHVMLTMAIL